MSSPIRGRRIQLVDSCIIGDHTPDTSTPCVDNLPPGALLPPDFPRTGYTADQLCELEEWYLSHSQTALQRFFYLTRTTRDGGEPTARSVVLCVAILAKLFGFNPDMSWAAIARQLGTGASHLCKLRREVWRRLKAGMHSPSRFELSQTAIRLRRLARMYSLAAALKKPHRNSPACRQAGNS